MYIIESKYWGEDGQIRKGSRWHVYPRKDSRTKEGPLKVESKDVKSWEVRLFQVKEAVGAEVQRQQSTQHCVEEGRRQPN